MAKWVERIIVKESPNFYMEAVELMDQFYQWKADSEDNTDQESSWWDKHLVKHPEYFTLSAAEVDELFKDVSKFVKECRRSAFHVLSSRYDFQRYFAVKAPEHSKEMPGFLKEVLAMSDIQSVKDLTRDEFVTCCLMCLYELSDKLQTEEHDFGSPEEGELYDKVCNPDLDMKEVFDIVTTLPYSASDQMTILRLFQDIDEVHGRLREVLIQLEQICSDNFYIVKDRFIDKVQKLKTDEGKSYCNYWVERAKLQIDDFRKDEPIYLEAGIISYGALSMRFSPWYRSRLRLTAGLLFDDLSNLEDKGRFQDEMTQRQLKAIADPTRYKIIRQLSVRPHYVQEMADALKLTAATLSHHLTALQMVMLVGVSIKGRKSYYFLNADELEELGSTLKHMAQRSRMED